MREHYEKSEYKIPMRDGKTLFTVVYMPKDQTKTWPILMNRTCYNASSYADYKAHGAHRVDRIQRVIPTAVSSDRCPGSAGY